MSLAERRALLFGKSLTHNKRGPTIETGKTVNNKRANETDKTLNFNRKSSDNNDNDDDKTIEGNKVGDEGTSFNESAFVKWMYDIFLWEDVPTSLYAFVVSNTLFYALVKLKISLLTLFIHFSLLSIAASFAAGYGSTALCRYLLKNDKIENPADRLANAVDFPRERITRMAAAAGDATVKCVEFICNVIFFKDPELSQKAGCMFLALGILSQKYTLAALLWLTVDFCFIWFPLYKYQREAVDECYDRSAEFAVAQISALKEDSSKLIEKYLKTN